MKDKASKILQAALDFGANDLYFLPEHGAYQVYLRNSMERRYLLSLEAEQATAIIAHFKFLAGMNVGEKRRTQLGSLIYEVGGQKWHLRLSTVGDYQAQESLVIRILYRFSGQLEFWEEDDYSTALHLIRNRGLYLFSGPVGSGKTTLMYAIAAEKFQNKQVITIEDPVEIIDDQFLQLTRNDLIGNSYDELIKLSLRHMPDLLIVGEIRDEKTAKAVIRASLTGYTVFSTIHAKSISGLYARLLELGLGGDEISNSLNGVIYQRLLKGKGVLDLAGKDFRDYQPDNWNQKIDRLWEKNILTAGEADQEKID